jgi:glycosyltransferase involved in cell wall biosynthesis
MKKKIKVLHIIKTLGLGGAETNLLNLAGAFDQQKIETHVAYSYGGEIEQRFRNAGMRLFKYADQSHRVKSLHTVLIVLKLVQYIKKHKIDIIQTHNFNGHVWGLMAAKLSRTKLIEHVHDFRYTPTHELARRHGLQDQYRFTKYFKNQADRVIVLTQGDVDYVVNHGFAQPQQVVEMQNGIPLDDAATSESNDLRAQLHIPADAVVILTSARMDPTKNVDLILRIAKRVVQVAPKAFFLVAGNGAHLDAYRKRCSESGLDGHVLFMGFHQDMYALLATSDIYLLPSFLELHSIAILEALKMKVPVVVSEGVGCNGEFIENGENGFLCDPFQEQPWIDALTTLANSADLRQRVGMKGHETCRRLFDIHTTAAELEKLYVELVD